MDNALFSLNQLKKSLKCNSEKNTEGIFSGRYRRAGVLVPFVFEDDEWHLLFTRRSDTLNSHRGQVSFPGGAMDVSDGSVEQTAIREANEEIGLVREDIDILGCLPEMLTVSDFLVTPVLSIIRWPVRLKISPDEVSRVFTIPLNWLNDKNNWEDRPFTHPSGWHGSVIFYNKYDGELLWGISAKITVELMKLLFDKK